MNTTDWLASALRVSTKYLIAERDALYDSITDSEGNITDPDDGEGLKDLDAIIDNNQIALKLYEEGK